MLQLTAATIENVPMAERTYRIRLRAPEIAAQIRPGQFVMLKAPGSDPLLGRPFALYDVAGDAIDVVYLVVGKLTSILAEMKSGDAIEVWGPLGNGFPDLEGQNRVTLIAGGIGQTPFLAYARQMLGQQGYGGEPARRRLNKVGLYYGVRTASLAAGVEDFQQAGAGVHLASDDGSMGARGYITDLLAADNAAGPWIGCGPEPMLHALTKLAAAKGVECYLSLETPMACGFGVCFSCVTKVKTAGGWDYKRVCVDGPVFNTKDLVMG
jgi:dihydroorotate dehydrogenase electron transfer subunit